MKRARRLSEIWSYLPVFRAVAETEGLSAAAKSLGLTPSAVTRAMQALEDRLGSELLTRGGRSVRLNDAGLVLASALRIAMRTLDEAVAVVQEEQRHGTVRVTTSEPMTSLVAAPACRLLADEHPRLRVVMQSTKPASVPAALQAGTIDVALVHQPTPGPEVQLDRLGELKCAVFGRADRPSGKPARFIALAADPRGVSNDGWPAHVKRDIAIEVEDFDTAASIARQSDWLVVLPRWMGEERGLKALRAPALSPIPVFVARRVPVSFTTSADVVVDAIRRAGIHRSGTSPHTKRDAPPGRRN